MNEPDREVSPLTGRIQESPSALLHEEVLGPQFAYEVQHLLHHYIRIEKVFSVEYERMGLLPADVAAEIRARLSEIASDVIQADPAANMSDISFAIERYVEDRLTVAAAAWHIDRSRNDFQACAQLMLGRDQLVEYAANLVQFGCALHEQAIRNTGFPMPGYTHFQSAQVMTPGFYLSAMVGHVVLSLQRLLGILDEINRCPLGAGAMTGLELPWNRRSMAELLGFGGPQPHALTAVASRDWVLRVAGELSLLGTTLSRFATDLMQWGSSDCRFIDLPDALSGISSAMPQKKNYPVLERIRGKTAHLAAYYLDFSLSQRNTPYTNLVEVSKEGSTNLIPLFNTAKSSVRLFTLVVSSLRFNRDRLQSACEREFLGGFTVANLLTLEHGIPYREAQVITGRFITAALAQGLLPRDVPAALLTGICREHGYSAVVTPETLRQTFDPMANLCAKRTEGSAHPERVQELLASQAEELAAASASWSSHRQHILDRYAHLNTL